MPDSIFDRFPRPPAADLLGWTLLDHDVKKGWIKLAFEGRKQFLNPAGFIQGGILAAMLDDTMGPAALVMSEGRLYTATIDMNVTFIAPAKPGRLIAEGQVIHLGKTIAFAEARLSDENGTFLARATSSARVVPVAQLTA
jgi:uncharacterized protein (TIGR00369 family)